MYPSDDSELSLLKMSKTVYPNSPETAKLEAFQNRFPERNYVIQFDCPEFTSLCPVTGQPDFAKIKIIYIPQNKCIESKSLKLFLGSFRNVGMFHEEITNSILENIVKSIDPKWALVIGIMNPRGGISIRVLAEHKKDEDSSIPPSWVYDV
ncbi:MAG: preQ(1) synthase [Syntrophaceae bacterium]|nr:preQ(1) synthase [Syntrophaceae bacterium]